MLQAGTALMYNSGYRPRRRDNHHMAVVIFIENIHSRDIPSEAIVAFNNGRSSRHQSQYDMAGTISHTQAKNMVEHTEDFVKAAGEILGIPV